jgi:RNA polymerase subunit RPABC4/transcription elongation factor Spt4
MAMNFNVCPVCHSSKYKYQYWTEFGWGTVEQHGYCDQCGYIVDQAYSQPISGHELP